jgi:4-amino-4-deoxy-L-arabinose transferase-like glycosyltransferase
MAVRHPESGLALMGQYPQRTLIWLTLIPRVVVLLASAVHRSTAFGSEAHDGYLQIAQNFVANSTLGFDAHHLLYRGPVLPLLLSPGVWLGHPELWSAVLHLLASVGTCLLVFAAAMMLTGSVTGSFAAASLVTLDPWLIWFVKTPMTPVTATFFVAAAVFFFAKLLTAGRPIAASLGLGATCALGTLDHPALIALVGGLTLAILIARWSPLVSLSKSPFALKTAVISVAALWFAFLMTLLPYTIRNYRDSGRFVLVADSAGLTYFLGTQQYAFSPLPWGHVQPYDGIADRLHVTVHDLDVKYFTIDDRFYPELNKQARNVFQDVALHHFRYLAKRTAVMAFWLFFGDYSFSRTVAHLLFFPVLLAGWWGAWRAKGFMGVAPFLALILPGAALHSLTMSLNGHAAYSIPYIVPLAMPMALALAKRTAPELSQSLCPPPQGPGEMYVFERN